MQATKTKQWLLGILVVLLTCIAAIYSYNWHENRVLRATIYDGIQLGMGEGEVLVNFGRKPECLTGDMKTKKVMGYNRDETFCKTNVTLEKNSAGKWGVSSICGPFRPHEVNLGSSPYEEYILKRLGPPSSTSIEKSGLIKVSSFNDHNLAITFSAKEAIEWCVTTNLPLKYTEEFQGS